MANPKEALDTAILNHLAMHPRAHPLSSPGIHKLARLTQECQDGQLSGRVIEARMKALRSAGQCQWDTRRRRYVVAMRNQQ
jgi:hypothetical protein